MNQSFLTESILLELQNGALGYLSLCLTIIFLRYIYLKFGMGYKFLEAAISLITIWVGTAIIRIPLWIARYNANQGEVQAVPNDWIIVGSVICIVGFLCAIRVFSEGSWKKWAWKLSAVSCAGFLLMSYYKVLPI